MQFLVEWEGSREVITWGEDVFQQELLGYVQELFNISDHEQLLLQKFDKDWDEWINIKPGDKLNDKAKLKCLTRPKKSTPANVTEIEDDANGYDNGQGDGETHQVGLKRDYFTFTEVSPRAIVNGVEKKMTSTLTNALKNELKLQWAPKHELIQLLSDALYKADANASVQIKRAVAKALVDKYPHLKNRIGPPESAWYEKINNAIKAKRSADNSITPKRRRKIDVETSRPEQMRGETGWQPVLPHNDLVLLQQQKDMLKRENTKKEKDENKIKDLMDVTYAHRRELINSNAETEEINQEYPALFTIKELYNEFSRLTNIDLDATFIKKFPGMAAKLVLYISSKKKKSTEISRILAKCKSVKTGQNDLTERDADMICSVLLLPHILREKPQLFYITVENPRASPEEAVDAVAAKGLNTAPLMVICGEDPWTSSLIYIVCDGHVLLEVNELCQAMCISFSLFYVLNIRYPKTKEHDITGTLSFIQKCIFGLNDAEKVMGRVESLAAALE